MSSSTCQAFLFGSARVNASRDSGCRWRAIGCATALLIVLSGAGSVAVADPAADKLNQAVTRAIDYLSRQGQAADGSFSAQAGPGVTALVATSILRHGRGIDDPVVAKALGYLGKFVQPDGGIHAPDSLYANYETCLSILCFREANRDGRYDELLARAEAFVKHLQWDDNESSPKSSPNFGGAGYGGHKRPDLSNTSFLLDALKSLGRGPDDPAVERALVFVSRCQNLESEHNTTEFAAKNPDGGFYYTPAAGGNSQAGPTPQGGLRSYGSMTYAGLKSMIYAGVAPDDPRVQAAKKWIAQFYTLEENPGMGTAGLFYYYHTFAKALDALGEAEFFDATGASHSWRTELIDELAKRQRESGAWTNDTTRWLEGDPNLVTGYALLALSYCRPPAP